jgi:hypothetical protein
MTDWFMPPVNHLQAARKRMVLPGAIRLFNRNIRNLRAVRLWVAISLGPQMRGTLVTRRPWRDPLPWDLGRPPSERMEWGNLWRLKRKCAWIFCWWSGGWFPAGNGRAR